MAEGSVIIDMGACMACGCCVQACPFDCLALTRTGLDTYNKAYPELKVEPCCTGCGLCAQACPVDCIQVVKK